LLLHGATTAAIAPLVHCVLQHAVVVLATAATTAAIL
jgi:hypothetical protein